MPDDINLITYIIQELKGFAGSEEGVLIAFIATVLGFIIGFFEIRGIRGYLRGQENKRDKKREQTRYIRLVITGGIIAFIVSIIGFTLEMFYFSEVYWKAFLISIAVFLLAILIQRRQGKNDCHFTAQLGNPRNSRFLSKEKRLEQIQIGNNPYDCCPILSENSPMFYGRQSELERILSVLRKGEKPGSVSILGEQNTGKSSLLNQIKQSLTADAKVVCIQTVHNWKNDRQETFFTHLHQAICNSLKIQSTPIDDYIRFRQFIRRFAKKKYRFVLMIDGFESMMDNNNFDVDFFANMRALGEQPEYQFGYVLASYKSLRDIFNQRNKETRFWNIFGTHRSLGLLTKREAEKLIQEPMQRSLGRSFKGMKDIFYYSGYNPAFIQLVAAEYWNARYHGHKVNSDTIQQMLRDRYKDIWKQRDDAERDLLRQIVKHEIPQDNLTLVNLRQRGLIDGKNQLFARFFEQMISENEV